MQNNVVFKLFYTWPAAVLRVFQRLLRLAGIDEAAAFPEGIWQFYIDYALRDDTARHACETNGFDGRLNEHDIQLSRVDRLTAWVMTAVNCLHQYPDMLKNEWRERMYIHILWQITQSAQDAYLYRQWEGERPYSRGHDAGRNEQYPAYRSRQFDTYLKRRLSQLPQQTRTAWQEAVNEAESTQLLQYQQQMSILSYLQTALYGETRTPIPLEQTQVGLIIDGRYYLIPSCQTGTRRPIDAHTVRSQIAAILTAPTDVPPARLHSMAAIKREHLTTNWALLTPGLQTNLIRLRMAPIWINGDPVPQALPLARLRQTERGIGDHPLTIFDTGQTAVFDLSHIFFDGTWGAALAEILTNEALSWATYLHQLPQATAVEQRPNAILVPFSETDRQLIKQAVKVPVEATAETDIIDLEAMITLREQFKQREDLKLVTINDLLLLYRAIHAIAYRPAPAMIRLLTSMQAQEQSRTAATTALHAIRTVYLSNPAILIPVDASRSNPQNRVAPMTFEVPMTHLAVINRHQQTLAALTNFERSARNRQVAYTHFRSMAQDYLSMLASLGHVLKQLKDDALAGESLSIKSIKLLAHLPTPVQRRLDKIPAIFDEINDAIKGREVFSNVGMAAANSSLTRFITAKDDNEKKELAWGAITDAQGVMRVALRDFRPHVAQFTAVRRHDIAVLITQDLLNSYATGLNNFVHDLLRILKADHTYKAAPLPATTQETKRLLKIKSLPLPPVPAVSSALTPALPSIIILPKPKPAQIFGETRRMVALASTLLVVLLLGSWFIRSRANINENQIEAVDVTPPVLEIGLSTPVLVVSQTLPPPPTPILPTSTPGSLRFVGQVTISPTLEPPYTSTPLPTATPYLILLRERDQMPMVRLPETTFNMGANENDPAAEADERPLHSVHLHSFYFDQYEVSVIQYAAFLNEIGSYVNSCFGFTCLSTKAETSESHLIGIVNGGYVAEAGYESLPINHISWYGAAAYCEWAGVRLPSEAEWEYAAAGQNGRLYPWGSTPPDSTLALFAQTNSSSLQPVAALQAGTTDHGIFGLAGSVWEWVADGYDTFYYQYSPVENPTGPLPDNFTPHVLRGGSFQSTASELRATNRHQFSPTEFRGTPDIGFRCAMNQNN